MTQSQEDIVILHEKLALYKMMENLEDGLVGLERLHNSDFVDFKNANLFSQISSLITKEKNISFLSVKRSLLDQGDIDAFNEVDGVKNEAPGKQIDDLCSFIIEQAKLRELDKLSKDISSELSQGHDSDTISNRVMNGLIALDNRDTRFELENIGDLLQPTEVYLQSPSGIKTGLKDFDELTGGYKRKELTVIGGRPAMGKSAFALWSAYNIAKRGIPVVFFSIEMSKEDLMCRLFADKASIIHRKFSTRSLSQKDLDSMKKIAPSLVKDIPLFINDKSDISINQIISKCMSMKMKYGDLGAIFVDFIQLMRMPRGMVGDDNKAYLIGETSKVLKGLGKDLGSAVILLSQVKREVETRQDKRPVNSDLAESGNLEQQAGMIVFPFRPYVYSKDKGEEKECEIITTKNRHGDIGTVYCTADLNYQRFENKPAIV